jgi:hypothetical protein
MGSSRVAGSVGGRGEVGKREGVTGWVHFASPTVVDEAEVPEVPEVPVKAEEKTPAWTI